MNLLPFTFIYLYVKIHDHENQKSEVLRSEGGVGLSSRGRERVTARVSGGGGSAWQPVLRRENTSLKTDPLI